VMDIAKLGAKCNAYNNDETVDKRRDLYFTWTIDPNLPPMWAGNRCTNIQGVLKCIEAFAEFAGVNGPEEVQQYFSAVSSYYDSYEVELNLTVSRKETDEEYAARADKIAAAKVKAKEAAKKAAETKAKNEREQYERLKKKFESQGS
jgi:hypothetical protein